MNRSSWRPPIDAESNLKAVVGGLSGPTNQGNAAPAAGTMPTPSSNAASARPPAAAKVGHQASGTVDSIDQKSGTVSLKHGPVATLKWPAMKMEFKAAHTGMLKGLAPGQSVNFEFVERQPGEYVVTTITAAPRAASAAPAAPPSAAHSGH